MKLAVIRRLFSAALSASAGHELDGRDIVNGQSL